MKIYLLIIIELIVRLNVFCQASNKLSADASRNQADSIIAKYESEGLKLYNDSMYYAAIDKFTKAGKLIDSLYRIKHKFSDKQDYTITMCNIALCGFEMNCFTKGDSLISMEWPKWYDASGAPPDYPSKLLYTYCSLISGEEALAMHNSSPIARLFCAMNDLPKGIVLNFRYAIKSFSYVIINTELGDYYSTKRDTATTNLYYRKIIKK